MNLLMTQRVGRSHLHPINDEIRYIAVKAVFEGIVEKIKANTEVLELPLEEMSCVQFNAQFIYLNHRNIQQNLIPFLEELRDRDPRMHKELQRILSL